MESRKKEALLAVEYFGGYLEMFPEFQNDRDVVITAVKNTEALKLAHSDQQKDKNVVMIAVKAHGHNLRSAHKDLRNDKEVVLQAVRRNGMALLHASDKLKGDEEVAYAAARQNQYSLRYASNELRGDGEFLYKVWKFTDFVELAHDTPLSSASHEIQENIRENPEYLHRFQPSFVKPAR